MTAQLDRSWTLFVCAHARVCVYVRMLVFVCAYVNMFASYIYSISTKGAVWNKTLADWYYFPPTGQGRCFGNTAFYLNKHQWVNKKGGDLHFSPTLKSSKLPRYSVKWRFAARLRDRSTQNKVLLRVRACASVHARVHVCGGQRSRDRVELFNDRNSWLI